MYFGKRKFTLAKGEQLILNHQCHIGPKDVWLSCGEAIRCAGHTRAPDFLRYANSCEIDPCSFEGQLLACLKALSDDDGDGGGGGGGTDPVGSISLSKVASFTDGDGSQVGDILTYTLTVTNDGDLAVDGIEISDAMLGLAGVAPTPAAIAPGASTQMVVDHVLTQADLDAAAGNGGWLTNDAMVIGVDSNDSGVGDSTTVNTTLPEQEAGAVSLLKECAILTGLGNMPGDEVEYTFTVTNTGTSDLSLVEVEDAVLGVTDLAVTPATIAPGGTGTATYTHTLTQADLDSAAANGGVLTNQATVSAEDEAGEPVSALSNTHQLQLPEPCSNDPIKVTCSEAGQVVETVAAGDVPENLTPTGLTNGQFGSGEFGGTGDNSLSGVVANGGVVNIPVPAHTEGCQLFLHIVGGQIDKTGLPQLQGVSGGADVVPTERFVQDITGNTNSPPVSGDIFHSVYSMDGTGNGTGTVDVLLPGLVAAENGSGDLLQYHWSEVCSGNDVDVQAACFDFANTIESTLAGGTTAQGTNVDGTLNTPTPALMFTAGRHVGHDSSGAQDGQTNSAWDWSGSDTGAEIYDRISLQGWQCQSGLGMDFLPAGDFQWEYRNNSTTANSAGWAESAMMTAIPLVEKVEPAVEPVEVLVGGECLSRITSNLCDASDVQCEVEVDIPYNNGTGGVITVTPIYDDVADTANAQSVNTAGSGNLSFDLSKTVANLAQQGDEFTGCKFEFLVQISGGVSNVSVPDFDVCLTAAA